jgi:hypothetical protein
MTDLPGKPGKHDVSRFAPSVTAAIQMIRAGSVATMAGDDGAINAYRDDTGKLRGQRMVHMGTRDDRTFRNLKTLAAWYRRALSLIRA